MRAVLKRTRIAANCAMVSLILPCLSGCVIGGHNLTDEPIGKERVEKIRPGQTPIREVMTQLGPPDAIARQGQTIVIPHDARKGVYLEIQPDTFEIQPDTFFELFSSYRILKEDEVVYYYQASRIKTSGLLITLLVITSIGTTERIQAERLWLVVNERTGLVADFVYRGAGDDDDDDEYVTPHASELMSR